MALPSLMNLEDDFLLVKMICIGQDDFLLVKMMMIISSSQGIYSNLIKDLDLFIMKTVMVVMSEVNTSHFLPMYSSANLRFLRIVHLCLSV